MNYRYHFTIKGFHTYQYIHVHTETAMLVKGLFSQLYHSMHTQLARLVKVFSKYQLMHILTEIGAERFSRMSGNEHNYYKMLVKVFHRYQSMYTIMKHFAEGLSQLTAPNCIKDFLDLPDDTGQSGLSLQLFPMVILVNQVWRYNCFHWKQL